MPSLRQLRSLHPRLLLVDAASARVQVALWPAADATADWATSDDEAGVAAYTGVEQLLAKHALRIGDLDAFAFCEGPGSILGIRTTAMAMRVWKISRPTTPVYAYQSLTLVAAALADPAVNVIADARRDTWHLARVGAPLARLATADLPENVTMPDHFRHWSKLPPDVRRTSYDLAELFARDSAADADLFRVSDAPDAFLHEEPTYATWDAQIHRAPPASR